MEQAMALLAAQSGELAALEEQNCSLRQMTGPAHPPVDAVLQVNSSGLFKVTVQMFCSSLCLARTGVD